jgi:ketosteroid isomerase-like protein
MMTDKTAYFEPHLPAMTGKDAVAKFFAMAFEQFEIEMVPVITDVQVEGNLAVMHGTYTQKLTPKAEGAAAMPDSGNWTVAARRQADGSWKWDWIMGASDQPMPGTTADGAEEQAVMQFERDAVNAMLKRDMTFIERGIAKEYTSVTDGKVDDVKKMMAEFKAGIVQIESATLGDLKAYVFGDAAIATMTGTSKGTYAGKPFSTAYRETDFLIKRDGRWQIVSGQSTTIKQ